MEEASIGTTIVVASVDKDKGMYNKRNVADVEPAAGKEIIESVIQKRNSGGGSGKRGRFDRCFSSYAEISSPSPDRPLENVDSNKFKEDIKKWAKSVAVYARQLSDRFGNGGSSRHE